jgi:uncharacterized DUF497 family protein
MSTDPGFLLRHATGFEWDDGNAPKVAARHGVTPGECEQMFFCEPLMVIVDATHSGAEPRWRALGRTSTDRQLHVVFTFRGDRIRVIHARDMNRKERLSYEQAKARVQADSDL